MGRKEAGSLGLLALAVLPQAVKTLATSFPLEMVHATDPGQLHRLHRARPALTLASLGALGGLALRRSGWLFPALGLWALFEGLAQLLTAEDAHPAHDEAPLILSAAELDRRLAPDEPVLGLFLNGEARCYPLALLSVPAALHDWVGGEPVAPTWSPASHAGLALRDAWQGRRLQLQAVGAPHDDLTLFDRTSGGLISQLKARILTGPNRGAPLECFPLTLTRWGTWRALHPDTSGAWFETGWRGGYLKWLLGKAEVRDARQARPLYATSPPDPRLSAKAPVLGVYMRGRSRAYPREALAAAPVRNDELGGTPIVVIHDRARDIAAAYSRLVDGQVLEFDEGGPGLAIDRASGTRFDVTGRAVDGPLAGALLAPVGLSVDKVHWFAWAHAHPRTTIAEAAEVTITRSAPAHPATDATSSLPFVGRE